MLQPKNLKFKKKKIVAFDLKMDKDDSDINTSDNIYKKPVISLIKNASIYQNLIMLTWAHLSDAQSYCKSLQLKSGYIAASGGAMIYDIAKKSYIYKKAISADDVSSILHNCSMIGINIVFHTAKEKIVMVNDLIGKTELTKTAPSPYKYFSDYNDLKKYIEGKKVYLIACFMSKDNRFGNRKQFLEDFYENTHIVLLNDEQESAAYFSHKDNTKFRSIQRLMENCHIFRSNDIIYYGITSLSPECVRSFNTPIILQNSKNLEYLKSIKFNFSYKFLEENLFRINKFFGADSNSFWK